MRIYWKPSAPPLPSFRRLTSSNAGSAAVTFNSRARRRPICVVRTPITPDKTRVIYLPSTRDAITRPLLTFLLRHQQEGARREDARNKKKYAPSLMDISSIIDPSIELEFSKNLFKRQVRWSKSQSLKFSRFAWASICKLSPREFSTNPFKIISIEFPSVFRIFYSH